MTTTRSLPARFREHLASLPVPIDRERVVVALSGGLDSVVLLHLLRFTEGFSSVEIVAAHLDHALRPDSAGDAAWTRGLCAAWRVPFRAHRLPEPPASEEEARHARYGWLEKIREGEGARWILTAHHAVDQAETILFRAVRGTGLRGLRGMASVRRGRCLVRPLLPFWRKDLEGWATSARLGYRLDSSNQDRSFARNVLRHDVIPRLEAGVAPGAKRSLVRLGRLAGRTEEGFHSLLAGALDSVVAEASADRIVIVRSAFLEYHPEVRTRVLRELARRLGARLDEAGTRAALEFTKSGASGKRWSLRGGIRLSRDFDHLRLTREERPEAGLQALSAELTREVTIQAPGAGEDVMTSAHAVWHVGWSGSDGPALPGLEQGGWAETFRLASDAFPLRLREWLPGDRIIMTYGTKKVSKLFAEAQLPTGERSHHPVLVDKGGRVLWVPGVARAAGHGAGAAGAIRDGDARQRGAPPGDPDDGQEGDVLIISVQHADSG